MIPILAAFSPEAIGTAFAGVVASITGYAAYRTSVRQKATDDVLEQTNKTAELAKTEVNGWTTLINTLTEQYKVSMNETGELRRRLTEGNRRFEELGIKLAIAKDETHEGLLIIRRLESEVRELRARISELLERISEGAERDVRRVEADVHLLRDAVSKPGRQGEQGAVGKQGDKGAKGDTGSRGAPGHDAS